MKKRIMICVALCWLLTACSGTNEQGQNQESTQPHNVAMTHDELEKMKLTKDKIAIKAKNETLRYEEINEVIAVHHDKELIVGFNVEKLEEFNVMEVEEKVRKNLKKKFPEHKITVSHDLKILLELNNLVTEKGDLSEKEIEKKINEIKRLSKEKT
ncbi:YhcN/YlaJ family sporulation lipoprotein [Bacillus pinisoli]|uniref:YhcN/YlaJ family sporulation lipoprotein n=1 Tax=Bacillus pinisoli TaxID=2901866 RepID=UPI001FF0FEB3|nr:YhcN/YlaJ family sporulation lipoprotein [Bacillus pinisoli]